MKSYCLKTKQGEAIKTIIAEDLPEAEEVFSKMKNLDIIELLGIFIIEEVTHPKKFSIFCG